MAGQFVSVPMPWGTDDIGVELCPVCGQSIVEEPTCDHLLFTFFDEVGEFTNVAPDVEALVEQLPNPDESEDDEYPPDLLTALVPSESALCLYFPPNVTGGGISVCIDFAISTSQ